MVSIRPVSPRDARAIAGIYNYYVTDSLITFEEEPIGVAEVRRRMAEVTAKYPWLVACEKDEVVGYAYATSWRSRSAYRHSVESSVYLAASAAGRGSGTRLYSELLKILKGKKLHAAIGGVSLPNPASVALHEKLGFEKVAHFREVGFKFGQWIDVGYWEKLL